MNALNRLNGLVVKGCCKSNFWRTSHAIWSFSFVWLVPLFIFVAGAFTIFERPPTRLANFLGGGPPKGTSSTPPGTRFLRHLPRGLLIFTSGRKGTQVIPRHPGTLLGGSGKATLEAKLEDLGAILGGLGSQVGGLEANLGASWSQLGRFRCQLGGLGGNFTRFGGFYKNL